MMATGEHPHAERKPAYWWSPDWSLTIPTEAAGAWDVARPGREGLKKIMDGLGSSGERLRGLSSVEIADALGRVGERILDEEKAGLASLVAAEAGFSPAMALRVVEGMANGWTRPALRRLLDAEFENAAVLDGFASVRGRLLYARGRGLTFHLGAGSVPGVTATSLIRALLVKCPSLAKPGAGDVSITVTLLRLLWLEAPDVAAGAAVLYWEGGAPANREVEALAVAEAKQVVAYGGLEAMGTVRELAEPRTPVLLHGPRTGVVVADAETDAAGVAEAAALFDQRGCVSPHIVLFLGESEEALEWGRSLEKELQVLDSAIPPGTPPAEVSGRLHQLRGALDLRGAAGEAVSALGDHVLIADLDDVEPLGARTVWVVRCENEEAVEAALRRLGSVLQSVGIDDPRRRESLAPAAVAAGATRIVPVGRLAFPPPEWIHDGRGPLRELVRWAERE